MIAANGLDALRGALARAAHPLPLPPEQAPWNLAELADLLPAATPLTPAAVLVPVLPRPQGPTLLLTRRTESLTHHAGQIAFPGGRIEDDDADAIAAALRETEEEIGLPVRCVEPLGFLDRYATITGFSVTPVLALLDPSAGFRPDPGEVAEVFEVPLAFALDPAQHVPRSREFRGRVRHYHAFEWERREIWGATASMIVNLARRLEAVR